MAHDVITVLVLVQLLLVAAWSVSADSLPALDDTSFRCRISLNITIEQATADGGLSSFRSSFVADMVTATGGSSGIFQVRAVNGTTGEYPVDVIMDILYIDENQFSSRSIYSSLYQSWNSPPATYSAYKVGYWTKYTAAMYGYCDGVFILGTCPPYNAPPYITIISCSLAGFFAFMILCGILSKKVVKSREQKRIMGHGRGRPPVIIAVVPHSGAPTKQSPVVSGRTAIGKPAQVAAASELSANSTGEGSARKKKHNHHSHHHHHHHHRAPSRSANSDNGRSSSPYKLNKHSHLSGAHGGAVAPVAADHTSNAPKTGNIVVVVEQPDADEVPDAAAAAGAAAAANQPKRPLKAI